MNQIVNDVITCQNVLYEKRGFKNSIQKYHQCYPVSLCISSAYVVNRVIVKLKGGIVLIKRKGFSNKIPSIHIWCEYMDEGETVYVDPTYLQYETDTPSDNQIKIEKILKHSLDYEIVEDSIVEIPPSEDEKVFITRLIELQAYEGLSLSESIKIVSNEINLRQLSFDGTEAYAFGCLNANKVDLISKFNDLISAVQNEAKRPDVKRYLETQKFNYTIHR